MTQLLNLTIERLKGGSEETRFQAVEELSRDKSGESISYLVNIVGDESYRVREKALEGICSYPPEVVFPRLETFLRDHARANLRTAAIEAFPRYGRAAVKHLLGLLGDRDEEVRMFSAVILGEIRDVAATEGLIAALRDSDENVRHAAAESLGKIGDLRSVDPLIQCLSGDFWVQYPAVVALGNMADSRAVNPLVQLLPDEMLRPAVIEALGKIGDPGAIPILGEILAKPDAILRDDVIAALVRIQARINRERSEAGEACDPRIRESLNDAALFDHFLVSLKSSEIEVRKNAVIALGWLKEKRAVRNLTELLGDYELEEYALKALTALGEDALPELKASLSHHRPAVRISAIRCLDCIGRAEGIRACIPLIFDENDEVRYQAIVALGGALGTPDVENSLLALLSDPDPEFRHAVVEILGKSRSPELVDKLIAEFRRGNHIRKLSAIAIMGRLEDPRALPFLQRAIKNETDEIRAEAYRSFTAIAPTEETTPTLMDGLEDKSPLVRKAVTESLALVSGNNAESRLLPYLNDLDPEIRLTVIEALGRIGKVSSLQPLLNVYRGGNKQVKMAVLRALGHIPDRSAWKFLSDCLQEGDADLKRVAAESLGEIADGRSVPDLVVLLDDQDWSVRNTAVRALRRIKDRRSVSRLIEKLKDPEDIIKREIISTLAELEARESVNMILPLIHNENLQLEVLSAIEKLGVPDLPYYFDFLKRSNTRLKGFLVDTLGRIREQGAVDYLANILADEFYTVRMKAARALGEIGDRRAIPFLLKARKDDPSPDVQKEAAWALTKLDERK
ncbi:MAG: HEAT repeat domain-containing protein [bacterium]|nr:HEAT repeat domain-containing protein [bacterium]